MFVTAFDQYALNAFDVHAVDYLLKPFDRERVLIRGGADVHIPPVDSVDYAQAQDDYVSIRSGGRAYLKEQTLADLERRSPRRRPWRRSTLLRRRSSHRRRC